MPTFYLDVDAATHQAYFDLNCAANLRLVAITMRDNNGTALYSAAWVPNDGRAWIACHGFTLPQLLQFYAQWRAQGMEMKALASTETLFAAVMEGTNTGTQFVYDLTDGTLVNQLNASQAVGNNFAPRAFAIYGALGATRRYAAVFEPCQANWAYRLWDTDATATQAIGAYFNDLRYRPTLLTYSPDGFIFGVFRDDSIGANNWTAINGASTSSITATYNSFADRGLWPLSLSVNDNDTFASVMVTTETSLPRQFSVSGMDVANLESTIDPLVQNLMQGTAWNTVGQPRVVSIAIAYQRRLMFAKAYTWADPTYPVATPTSLFRIASSSKPLTSIAIGRLIQDGLLVESDTVAKINLSPPPNTTFPAGFNSITVGQLRTHRSGIQPANGSTETIAAAFGHPTPVSIYEQNAYWIANGTIAPGFSSPTNLKIDYQNCNYSLLGLIVRAVTNGLYADYVDATIFEPLGLVRPSQGASLHAQRPPLEVQHHSSNPSTLGPNGACFDPPLVGSGYGTNVEENFEAFGNWSVSTVDYVAMLAAVGVASQASSLVLNSASMNTMYTKIDPTGVQNNWTLGGLFWGTTPGGVTVFGHNGGASQSGLNMSTWVFSRSDGISIAVFMNMDDPSPLYDFVWAEGPGRQLSGQLQTVLDSFAWPVSGDLFPTFGITGL